MNDERHFAGWAGHLRWCDVRDSRVVAEALAKATGCATGYTERDVLLRFVQGPQTMMRQPAFSWLEVLLNRVPEPYETHDMEAEQGEREVLARKCMEVGLDPYAAKADWQPSFEWERAVGEQKKEESP